MPEPSHHPHAVAELAAVIATLDAVSLVADWAADDDGGDRRRTGLLHPRPDRLPRLLLGRAAVKPQGTLVANFCDTLTPSAVLIFCGGMILSAVGPSPFAAAGWMCHVASATSVAGGTRRHRPGLDHSPNFPGVIEVVDEVLRGPDFEKVSQAGDLVAMRRTRAGRFAA